MKLELQLDFPLASEQQGIIAMDAKEVYDIFTGRLDAHEVKCDKRQERIHDKLDHLAKVVYIGIGVMLVLEIILITFGPKLL